MSTAHSPTSISEDDYLTAEKVSNTKHELVDGQLFAMAGASKNHERIAMNLLSELRSHLKKTPCEPFGSDMKLRTPTGNFRYPDGMVICNDTSTNDYYAQSPTLLLEVISRSTRKIDEQIKRIEYINIPSLQEYVLIEQDYVDIAVFRKTDQWRPTHYFLGDNLLLESVNLSLPVEEIYLRVENQDMAEWLER